MDRPRPDWAGKTKQPKGTLGPPPGPNGRVVATRPMPIRPVAMIVADIRRITRPERPEDV